MDPSKIELTDENYLIRSYKESDKTSWIRCWAQVAVNSEAWLYVITDKPIYPGDSVQLVAVAAGEVIGFADVQVEDEPGSLCLKNESKGGFAWEFGVHPHLWNSGIGSALLSELECRLKRDFNVNYVEWWSMDPRSQKWYELRGMKMINEHWRFHTRSKQAGGSDRDENMQMVNAYFTCSVQDWPQIRKNVDVIDQPPLEPRLCRGFAHRF